MKNKILTENRGLWRIVICAIILNFQFSIHNTLQAQVAGGTSYAALDMPASARAAGVGFDFLSLYDDDLTLDDLKSPMPLKQRIVIIAVVICLIGAIAYYLAFMR